MVIAACCGAVAGVSGIVVSRIVINSIYKENLDGVTQSGVSRICMSVLVEVAPVIVGIFLGFSLDPQGFHEWVTYVACLIMVLASPLLLYTDLKWRRLPNEIVIPLGIVVIAILIANSLSSEESLRRALTICLVIGCFFSIFALIPARPLGMGDAKLAVILGAILGWYGWKPAFIGIICAHIFAGIIALVALMACHADRNTRLPFGPCLLFGAFFSLLSVPEKFDVPGVL